MSYKSINSSGFTLIETLVSLIVMSVGILSFALLQAESLRATHVSMQRTKAIHFATDIIERMRANTAAITEYTIAANAAEITDYANCSDYISGTTINCSPSQLATFDKWEWKQTIKGNTGSGVNQSGIVAGTGSVSITSVNVITGIGKPYSVTVVIAWNDRSEANSYTLNSVIL